VTALSCSKLGVLAGGSSKLQVGEIHFLKCFWTKFLFAATQQEGWAPSAYLEVAGGKKMSRQSSLSVSSQDSGVGTNGRFGQP